jgi:hypothetical protein
MSKNHCQELKELYNSYYQEQVPASFDVSERVTAKQCMEFQQRLHKKEFCWQTYQEKVVCLLTQWHGANSFIDAIEFEENGRVVIEGDLDLYEKRKKYFPSVIRKINGNFVAVGNNFQELDFIEEVGGLDCKGVGSLTSLQRLRIVKSSILLDRSGVENLSSLEQVNGEISIAETRSLLSLSSLNIVGGTCNFNDSNLQSLPNLEYVMGSLNIQRSKRIEEIPLLKKIGFSLRMSESSLKKCSSLHEIGVKLILSRTGIDDFSAAFPSLKLIGFNSLRSKLGYTVELEGVNLVDLREQIEELIISGRLQVAGRVQNSNVNVV